MPAPDVLVIGRDMRMSNHKSGVHSHSMVPGGLLVTS